MKILKRISIILLALCFVLPCFTMVANAADGRISFTDPSTTVGETFGIDCAIRTTNTSIGDVKLTLSYDSDSFKFVSGDGVKAGNDGQLTYSGNGNGNELKFTMQFQALKEGEGALKVESYNVTSDTGAAIECQEGASKVQIAQGDPSKIDDKKSEGSADDIEVEVDGKKYKLSDNFAKSDIPAGFSKAEMTFESKQRQMALQESSGIYLGYLIDEEGTGEFFLYEDETATFVPFEQVEISDTSSIILLNGDDINVPEGYQKVKLTMNDSKFPAWQNSKKDDGFYLLYAVNNEGKKGLYQYDSKDGTYQRFVAEETADKNNNSLLGKLKSFLEKHLEVIILVVGLGFLLFIVLVVILGIKLHNRNDELDELYEEYNIGEDEEDLALGNSALKDTSSKKKGLFKRNNDEDDEFETYNDEDFDDYEEDDYDEYEYEDDDYEDSEEEDIDESLERVPDRRRKKDNDHDEFTIDFIDLDL